MRPRYALVSMGDARSMAQEVIHHLDGAHNRSLGKDAWWLALLRWPELLLAVLGGLAELYRYGLSHDAQRWHWVTGGSTVAAVLWLGGLLLFS